jgi:N utilization substance protein B
MPAANRPTGPRTQRMSPRAGDPPAIAPGASQAHGRGRRPVRSRAIPRVETRARARAVQALYAWDIRHAAGSRRDLTRVAGEVWDDLIVPADERRLATGLVSLVAQHAGPIDRDLSEVTTNWRLERLGAIERSVLRLGAAELFGGTTPPRVVIQEAVRLAERYGSMQSAKFVNGVLDALARHAGRL